MKLRSASIQPSLFDQDETRSVTVPQQKEQLATLIGTLLLEITAASTSGEISDDQDHG